MCFHDLESGIDLCAQEVEEAVKMSELNSSTNSASGSSSCGSSDGESNGVGKRGRIPLDHDAMGKWIFTDCMNHSQYSKFAVGGGFALIFN